MMYDEKDTVWLSGIADLKKRDKVSVSVVGNIIVVSELKKEMVQPSVQVRDLLRRSLHELKVKDTLDDSGFPYRLVQSSCLVCFSHSSERVCIAFEYTSVGKKLTGLGVDTEQRHISQKVAQRFFTPAELDFLCRLDEQQASFCTKLLWMAKEAYVKTVQVSLMQGLGTDMCKYLVFEKLPKITQLETVIPFPSYQGIQFCYLPTQDVMLSWQV